MTLKDTIASDVDAVFLDEDDFAETITYYPLNDQNSGTDYLAVVDLDHEEGPNMVSGDGPVMVDPKGERERRTGIIEITSTLEVSDGDSFLIREELWFFKRHTGRDQDPGQDEGLQSLRLVRNEGRHTRQGRVTPTH
jgi:hypothetical protein